MGIHLHDGLYVDYRRYRLRQWLGDSMGTSGNKLLQQHSLQDPLTRIQGLLLAWFAGYGLTVGPLPYIFAVEMPAVKLRSKTINLSRIFYYMCDVVNGVVAPYAIVSSLQLDSTPCILIGRQNPTTWDLQGKAALIPASVSTVLIIWAYFRLPETNKKTYEELDLLFEAGVDARDFKDYDMSELKARAAERVHA